MARDGCFRPETFCAEDLRVEVNGHQLTVSGRRPVIPVHGRAVGPAIHRTDKGVQHLKVDAHMLTYHVLHFSVDYQAAALDVHQGGAAGRQR